MYRGGGGKPHDAKIQSFKEKTKPKYKKKIDQIGNHPTKIIAVA